MAPIATKRGIVCLHAYLKYETRKRRIGSTRLREVSIDRKHAARLGLQDQLFGDGLEAIKPSRKK